MYFQVKIYRVERYDEFEYKYIIGRDSLDRDYRLHYRILE